MNTAAASPAMRDEGEDLGATSIVVLVFRIQ
jgi:hypothetical protein